MSKKKIQFGSKNDAPKAQTEEISIEESNAEGGSMPTEEFVQGEVIKIFDFTLNHS